MGTFWAGADVSPSRQVGVLAAGSGGDSDTVMLSATWESPAFPPDKRADSPLGPVGGSDTAAAWAEPEPLVRFPDCRTSSPWALGEASTSAGS